MKNIELKIGVKKFKTVVLLLKKIGAHRKSVLIQKDTYFNCDNGRLKLRETNNKFFELIKYSRPDKCSSKLSNYEIEKLTRGQMRKKKTGLGHTLGIVAVVDKKRDLWMAGHTRIHLDSVKKLGKFLELETVISNISEKSAHKEHQQMIRNLELSKYKKYPQSYSDMILGV